MSLQWKLISQRPTTKRNLILIAILIISIGLILSYVIWDSCGVKHIRLLNDIVSYEKNLDPDFCDDLLFKIQDFNEQCEPEIEILDCG